MDTIFKDLESTVKSIQLTSKDEVSVRLENLKQFSALLDSVSEKALGVIANYKKEIASLISEKSDLEKTIQESTASHTGIIKGHVATINEKDTRSKALDVEISDKEARRDALDKKCAGFVVEIGTLEKSLTELRGAVSTLERAVSVLKSQETTLTKSVSEKTTELQTLTTSVETSKKELVAVNGDLAIKEARNK